MFGIDLCDADIACQPPVQQSIATHLEHGIIYVSQDHLAAGTHQRGKFHGKIPRTTGQVEHALACPHTAELHRKLLDDTVRAHGYQVIHHIIAIGD